MSALLSLLRRAALGLVTLVPLRTRTSWQWYRRARGGRWSRNTRGRWMMVRDCPGAMNSFIIDGIAPMPAGVEYTDLDGNALPPGDAGACHCEVWPS